WASAPARPPWPRRGRGACAPRAGQASRSSPSLRSPSPSRRRPRRRRPPRLCHPRGCAASSAPTRTSAWSCACASSSRPTGFKTSSARRSSSSKRSRAARRASPPSVRFRSTRCARPGSWAGACTSTSTSTVSGSSTQTTTCRSGTRAWRTKSCGASKRATSRSRRRPPAASAPPSQQTTSASSPTSTTNQNIGGVRAVACGPGPTRSVDCDVQRAGPFQWELLLEGKDYYVDPSGAWFALASRLDQSDYLAVSYIPVGAPGCGPPTGRCVGTFPAAASRDTAVVDTLRLVYDPRPGVTAATPSFRFEIRSAYRVGGSEVDRTTVALALTVNQRERTVLGAQTYLAQLGMALESDPTRFDQYNRLFPRTRDPQQGAPLRDYFAVFPHLTPFADTARLAPVERNDSLYRTPRLLLLTQSPPSVFALGVHASVSASSDRSQLS